MRSDDGLTAREFFNQLLLPEFPGGLKDPKWRSLQPQHAAFNRLTADGFKRLKAGDWYGEGILLPRQSGSKPERVEARLWDALEIDLHSNTAYGHGIEYAREPLGPLPGLPAGPPPEPAQETGDGSGENAHLQEFRVQGGGTRKSPAYQPPDPGFLPAPAGDRTHETSQDEEAPRASGA